MVVCKYFLNGSCKFGDRCRFEHPRTNTDFNRNASTWNQGGGQFSKQTPVRGNQGNLAGGSYPTQNQFAALGDDAQSRGRGPGAVAPASGFGDGGNAEPKPGEILESIKRDMAEWEGSGMWPYSSYRPTRAHGDMPGFQDLSLEELRLEAYLAEKENRFDAYKSAVSASASALQKKREMLGKPSQELRNSLISIYRGQLKAGSLGGQSIFGGQEVLTVDIFIKSGSTLFQNNAASGGFASPPTGLFSSPSSSGTPAASFGSSPATPAAGFGSSRFGSGFGAQSTTATPASPPHGLFGNPGASSAPAFSAVTQSFGSSGGLFGKPPLQANAAPQGLFGKPVAAPQVAAPQSTGLFGKAVQPTAPAGLFGKPAATPQASGSGSGGLFGKAPQATGLFGKPIQPEVSSQEALAKWHTPLGELTPEEKEQFEAPSFTLGKIPTRPPPAELVDVNPA